MKYRTYYRVKTTIYQLLAVALYLFFLLSILSFNPADHSNFVIWPNVEPTNFCGAYGAWWAARFYELFGYGVYLTLFIFGLQLLRFLFGIHSEWYKTRFIGALILQIATCAFITVLFSNNYPTPNPLYGESGFSPVYSTHLLYSHGGVFGTAWGAFFASAGLFLAYICILMMGTVGLLMYSDFVIPYIFRDFCRRQKPKTLRKILPWVRWFFVRRSGWNRMYHRPMTIHHGRRDWRTSTDEIRVSSTIVNDLDGDLPHITEGMDCPNTGNGDSTSGVSCSGGMNGAGGVNGAGDTEKTGNVGSHSHHSSEIGTETEDSVETVSEENGNENENENEKNGRKVRNIEEAVDGYEIGGENSSRRPIRSLNGGKNTQVEGAREISIHLPESTPMHLGVSGPEALIPTSGKAGDAQNSVIQGEGDADSELNLVEEHGKDKEPYVFPSVELLDDSEDVDYTEYYEQAKERAHVLEGIIQEYGFKVYVRDIQLGPTITQYQVEPEKGLRVAKIASLADDLAVKLGVSNVRIVYPLLGRQNLVGIEIPNVKKQLVRLREVIEQLAGTYEKLRIPMFLGKDVAGKPLVADLATMPHLLIAGRTGTGKSVCLNSIITSIIMTRDPENVRMLMIDPKMVEMSQYGTIPHLMNPVVTDMKKAEEILAWAVAKMEERYLWLSRARVRYISDYNKLPYETKVRRAKPKATEKMPENMPFIVIVVDEMADMMMTAPKEVESHIIRLAQKSRAVGIHLILATQKPIVTVITSLIKSNLPARIAFQVSSKNDSRVVLDENGADRLLGHGDMLFLLPGTSNLIRAQGTYLSDDEINRVVDSISTEEPQFEEEITQHLAGAGSGKIAEWAAKDELYVSAIEIIVNERRGSISLLQRMLGIGYGRAARLIDFMEEDKIVGAFNGYTKPRDVLLSKDDWLKMKAEWDKEQEDALQAEAERGRAMRIAEENLSRGFRDDLDDIQNLADDEDRIIENVGDYPDENDSDLDSESDSDYESGSEPDDWDEE
ncbi:MAG: DNA translocase FtsK 4TM domain-containing protein, partial [Planctomycetia bacterium]|nr:DNA translocase FtsK 4TM domain-containing protein [Planctomycetia bacterium]